MTVLHLGVIDVPYSDDRKVQANRIRTLKRGGKPKIDESDDALSQTTGDVAEALEAKYRVMGNFVDVHSGEIVGFFEESIGDALEDLLSGAPAGNNALTAATSQTEELFNKFIDTAEMETGEFVGGVPTQAALHGVNHRLKDPYSKNNPRRPSFKDTGLYEASFKAWVD